MSRTDNDAAFRYWSAVTFARRTLGDAVAIPFCDRLKQLSKTNTLPELQAIILGWRNDELAPKIDGLGKAIKTGVGCRGRGVWDAKKDAAQSAWAALFERVVGVPDDRAANIAGQTAARKIVRTEPKFVPLLEVEHADGLVETIHPFDLPDKKAGAEEDEFSKQVYRYIGELKQKCQVNHLLGLSEDDWQFLMRHIANRRKTRKDCNRAAAIKERLQRQFKKGMDKEFDGWDGLFRRKGKKP